MLLELDENVEYEERESEFDIADEDRSVKENEREEEDDLEVDVTTVQPITAYYSSDEEKDVEDNMLLYLPIAPEVEEPEEGWNPSGEGLEENNAHSGLKRSPRNDGQKENSSPKKKRTKSYDISLPNAPTDGKLINSFTFMLLQVPFVLLICPKQYRDPSIGEWEK